MGEILTGIRVFISISKSELKLEFEHMEARITVKSCIKLIFETEMKCRERHTDCLHGTEGCMRDCSMLTDTPHAACRETSTKDERITFRAGRIMALKEVNPMTVIQIYKRYSPLWLAGGCWER